MKTTLRSLQLGFTLVALLATSQVMARGSQLPKETPAPLPAPLPAPSPSPAPKPSASTSAKPLWEARHADGKEWTAHVLHTLDTLGKDMLDVVPADAKTYCPNYSKLSYNQRKEFWAFLMSAMVRHESNFKPEMQYKEAFADSSGKRVVSRGLLQISIESSQGYDCGINTASELHQPEKNLTCGIRILNRWVGRDGRFAGKVNGGWKGGARYWSVMRTTSDSYQEIIKATKALQICK